MTSDAERGLIQIYTGEGKGKTSAALGLAIRAAGQGMRVCFIQFLKGRTSGEHLFAAEHHAFEIIQISDVSHFSKPGEQLIADARQALACAQEHMLSGNYDVLILDEIFIAIKKKLITAEQVLDLIDEKTASLELILTGRYAPPEIIERAHLVTEMREIKHPLDNGIPARKGIEF